jgi:DNA transformation protein and related proteins
MGENRPIVEMRNLGPAMARWLSELDIRHESDLRSIGAVAAWNRLRFVHGRRVSILALYAMEAALIGCDWRCLTAEQKRALRAAADARPTRFQDPD